MNRHHPENGHGRGPRPDLGIVCLAIGLALLPRAARAQEVEAGRGDDLRVVIGGGVPLYSLDGAVRVEGASDAPAGSEIRVTIAPADGGAGEPEEGTAPVEGVREATVDGTVGTRGLFALEVAGRFASGAYRVTVVVIAPDGSTGTGIGALVVQREGRLPRRPLVQRPIEYAEGPELLLDDFQPTVDRWRIAPPPYEISVQGRRRDPYNQNVLKGDYPIIGQNKFLVLTARSDTLLDLFRIPTPSGVSADRPSSIRFFGDEQQFLGQQTVFLSLDFFQGDTAFKPIDWRIKATLAGNGNLLETRENAVVRPDVREGTSRTDGRASLQEFFAEVKLADLSPNYDFLSLRAGIQPFNSDFRGFLFTDTNLGVRLFGTAASNRYQYNLAYFERLEKDTNSGLNTFEMRDQQVAVANLYRQDLFALGHTGLVSIHYLRDEPTFIFDRNGFLVRPDPLGSFTPHEIEAFYLGLASFGHFGRVNVDGALYYATGDDSLNPLAGPDPDPFGDDDAVDISAYFAALELSFDRNWVRPKLGVLYASGDDDPTDRDAEGFAAIFDNPRFAGGGFSFWNRLGIRLAQTGVGLVQRGTFLPQMQSSREEGQPNFVNPGLWLGTVGLDLELTPKLRSVLTANYLRFDATEPPELALFQSDIDEAIGWDLSVGARWRPFLNENFVVEGGAAALLPGDGFTDIYEDDSPLYAGFTQVTLTF